MLGPKHQHRRAVVLTARKLVRLVVRLLTTNQPYQPRSQPWRLTSALMRATPPTDSVVRGPAGAVRRQGLYSARAHRPKTRPIRGIDITPCHSMGQAAAQAATPSNRQEDNHGNRCVCPGVNEPSATNPDHRTADGTLVLQVAKEPSWHLADADIYLRLMASVGRSLIAPAWTVCATSSLGAFELVLVTCETVWLVSMCIKSSSSRSCRPPVVR